MITVPLWLWLHFVVKWEDRNNYKLNTVRKRAKSAALARVTQRHADRELIEKYYQRHQSV